MQHGVCDNPVRTLTNRAYIAEGGGEIIMTISHVGIARDHECATSRVRSIHNELSEVRRTQFPFLDSQPMNPWGAHRQ